MALIVSGEDRDPGLGNPCIQREDSKVTQTLLDRHDLGKSAIKVDGQRRPVRLGQPADLAFLGGEGPAPLVEAGRNPTAAAGVETAAQVEVAIAIEIGDIKAEWISRQQDRRQTVERGQRIIDSCAPCHQ